MATTYALHIDWDNDGTFEAGEECTADMLSFSIVRGFSQRTARVAQVGRATFVMLNRTSTYTPIVNAAVRPMLRIRLTMDVNGTSRPLFTGWVEQFEPEPQWGQRVCTLTCSDLVYQLQVADMALPLQFGVRDDELIEAAIVAAGFASTKSPNSQQGIASYKVSSDRWEFTSSRMSRDQRQSTSTGSAFDIIGQVCIAGWGRWFVDGAGQWRYINRHHKAFGEGTDFTLYDDPPSGAVVFITKSGFRMSVGTVFNDVDVSYYPRIIGTVVEVLARQFDTSPLTLAPGETRAVALSYRDPSGTNATVGASSVVTLQSGVDFQATYEPTGDGASALADVSIIASYSANRADMTITNASATQNVYIRRLQVRGYAVRMRAAGNVVKSDAASIALYQRRSMPVRASLLNQQHEASRLGQYLLNQLNSPQQELFNIEVRTKQGDAGAEFVRDIEPMMAITLNHSRIGYSIDAFVSSIGHTMDAVNGHVVTITAEPINQYRNDAGVAVTSPFRIGDTFGSGGKMVF